MEKSKYLIVGIEHQEEIIMEKNARSIVVQIFRDNTEQGVVMMK